jgi:lipid-A-disaccharide synthase
MIAGEMSGDLLGAELIRELKKHQPHIEFEGIGGAQMLEEGFSSIVDMERMSVMGIVDVLKRYIELYKIRQRLVERWVMNPPDVFIGIDYADFNLGLACRLKKHGIKTVQYVSPKVWAWRQKRVVYIKKAVDLVLTLFPFEETFYQQYDVPAQFVGHPLADIIDLEIDSKQKKMELGFKTEDRLIAVLPGSRTGEIKYLGPLFLDVMQEISIHQPEIQFIVPLANANLRALFQEQVIRKEYTLKLHVTNQNAREVMAAADAVLVKSGTSTLEAMLLKRPMVVVFKWGAITHALIAPRLKIRFISLPNLLANRNLVPEFLQKKAIAKTIAQQVVQLLQSPEHEHLIQQFSDIHKSLRKNANENAALAILKLLGPSYI